MRFFVVLLAVLCFLPGISHADEVVATIQGKKIKASQIDAKLTEVFGKKSELDDYSPKEQEGLIRAMTGKILLDDAIATSGIADEASTQQALKKFKEEYIQKEYLKRALSGDLNDNSVKKQYNESVSKVKGKKEALFHQVLSPTRPVALHISEGLKECKRIQSIIDKTPHTYQTEMGYVQQGTLPANFEKILFSLNPGDISQPIQTAFGWHTITLYDKRDIQILPYETASFGIRHELSQQAVQEYMDSLLKKAKFSLKSHPKP